MNAFELNLKNAQSKANGQMTTASTQFHNPNLTVIKPVTASATILPPTEQEKTFHEKELDRMSSDPTNQHYKAAELLGKRKASAFLAAVSDTMNPQHEVALKCFRDAYNFDSAAVDAAYISAAATEIGAAPFEKQDPNYVRNLKAKYAPIMKSPVINQMYALFCEALDAKHAKVGYRGDKAFVAQIGAKFRISPNDHLLEHKQFVPKD